MTFLPSLLVGVGLFFGSGAISLSYGTTSSAEEGSGFPKWQTQLLAELEKKGTSPKLLRQLAQVTYNPKVVALDRKQSEFVLTLEEYRSRRVSSLSPKGKKKIQAFKKILKQIEKKYQVEAEVIAALWGMETQYGAYVGDFSLLRSLMTLAYDSRRADFFRDQLILFVSQMSQGIIPGEDPKGSWAGAMGQCQFMPTTIKKYAVDADGDGVKDLWNSYPDIFASIGNYLHQLSWKKGEPISVKVDGASGIPEELLGRDKPRSVSAWRQAGVIVPKKLWGYKKPVGLVRPDGVSGATYMVFPNFNALMDWNRSLKFAITVADLAKNLQDN